MTPSFGIYPDTSFDDYVRWDAVNASMLKRFVLDSPAHAKAARDGLLEDDTPALVKGTALHTSLLEPDRFAQEYVIGPEVRRNAKEWKDFEASNAGKTCMKPSENEDILGMRDRLWSDRGVAKLLNACDRRELSIAWVDKATGLTCKSRLDLYSTSLGMFLDVKTAACVKRAKFEWAAFDKGYHIQLAFQGRGLAALGLPVNTPGILAVESKAPWLPMVFEPDEAWLDRGEQEISEAMPRVADCLRTNTWPGYEISQPCRLSLPARAAERLS